MLVLFSMALFFVPAVQNAQAQSGKKTVSYCLDTRSGAVTFVNSVNDCAKGEYITSGSLSPTYLGVCIPRSLDLSYKAFPPRMNNAGTIPLTEPPYNVNKPGDSYRCLNDKNEATADFVKFPSTVTPVPPTTPPTTPPIKPPVNTGGNGSPGGSGGGTSGSNDPCDPAEEGFHKVGPLCVPNNPFDDDSIAGGDATAAGLATRIIKILLYFAAIVAVIMAIIGGYRIMTAGGNEAQALTGRKTLTNALIGLAVVILSYIIVQAVLNFITK